MAAERREGDTSHELRLEGIGLLLGGGLLLALLVGSFLLGRWVERRAQPPASTTAQDAGPLSQMITEEPAADAEDGLTHFDTVEGDQKEAEPRREIPEATDRREAVKSEGEGSPPAKARRVENQADLPFYVQVIALRDEQAAAGLIRTLEQKGYPVRLFTEREGQGSLYKVRVGGYESESEARAAVKRLREGGYPGAFLRPAD